MGKLIALIIFICDSSSPLSEGGYYFEGIKKALRAAHRIDEGSKSP